MKNVPSRTSCWTASVGDKRGDGGDHQHRTEALDQRPAEQQDGQVRAEGGRQRSGGLDGQADGERPFPAPDVAELGADEHERRNHQRVGGDHQLDAWIVVSRSSTICEIDTFMTLLSRTITDWAAARMAIGTHVLRVGRNGTRRTNVRAGYRRCWWRARDPRGRGVSSSVRPPSRRARPRNRSPPCPARPPRDPRHRPRRPRGARSHRPPSPRGPRR